MRKGLRSAVLNRGRRSSAGDKEEQCYEGREGRGQDEAVLKRKKRTLRVSEEETFSFA